MSTLEELLSLQDANIEICDGFIRNFKKCSKANQTIGYLKGRLNGISQWWKQFHENHINMIVLNDKSKELSPYFENDTYSKYEEVYYEYFGKITDLLALKTPSTPSNVELESPETKLPAIDLPKFSGDYDEWRAFRDMFRALVGDNRSLTGVQKLFFLINAQLSNLFNVNIPKECASSIRRLHDSINESLTALKGFDVEATNWDLPIIFIQAQRLPAETRQSWEQKISTTTEPPTLQTYLDFLEGRFRTLEALSINKSDRPTVQTYTSIKVAICECCKKNDHNIRRCDQFSKTSVEQRWKLVREKRICSNCLASHHTANNCSSKRGCSHCGQRHHSLLHREVADFSSNHVTSLHVTNSNHLVLLSTALIKVESYGSWYTLRALIDTGSQASFITTSAMQLLRLQPKPIAATITSLGGTETGKSYKMVQLNFSSYNDNSFQTTTNTVVLSSLTELIPQVKVTTPSYPHLANLTLADPSYYKPGTIDVILGSEVYPNIIREGLRTGPINTPVAQNTALGWIILGPVQKPTRSICTFFNKVELNQQLRRFWELEEADFVPPVLLDDENSESHYKLNHRRDENGRYTVSLPFKLPSSHLGSSLTRAISQFRSLERRMSKYPELKSDYTRCIEEYINLGHLEMIPSHQLHNMPHYYLPHHAVSKPSSTTTKIRVVFNASCQTDNGISLNDILCSGPSLHQDLPTIITRWRFHRYAFSADMEKMYRQVWISEKDADLQRILWRQNPNLPIQHYRLKTVTFGVTSAPYLAMRTVQQLVLDDGKDFPYASRILTDQLYVDNVLSGADVIEEALQAQSELRQLLSNGGFHLRQWAANDVNLLTDIPKADRMETESHCISDNTSPLNMLGVLWNHNNDTLSLKVHINPDRPTTTKREILSCISSLFDPLGWCAPVIIRAKIFMKKLWKLGLEWDDPVPDDEIREFEKIKTALIGLDQITIPRWVYTNSTTTYEIHGFCDSSKEAYSATIYIRVHYPWDNTFHTSFITAKTRVSPISKKEKKKGLPRKEPEEITIPKLELCGAALLAKLITKVIHDLNYSDKSIYCWSDSTIALAWLAKPSTHWKTFVANRVAFIQNSLPTSIWNHVSSGDNPADLATRGIEPAILSTSSLWWHGPTWLTKTASVWHKKQTFTTNEEIRNIGTLTLQTNIKYEIIPLCKFSSLTKLLRVTAFCFRFIRNCRLSNLSDRSTGFITSSELSNAGRHWITIIQHQCFYDEIKHLQSKTEFSSSSKIRNLNPVLDKDNIVRVGGRLRHADLAYTEKHPIILPYGHHYTKLIVADSHYRTSHGGLSMMMNWIRQSYWIPKLRSLVKTCIHHCSPCFRQTKVTASQLMGNLPKPRITPSRPFSSTGIDYAGPLSVRMSKGRSPKTYKGYIAVFVCFVTKAIHLEAVSDLTTEALLAALRRFIARRGLCKDIYSDCGTNFVGAKSILDKTYNKCIRLSSNQVAELLANDGINWHFIPAGSPHFGGLWEAGVRSVKHHLRRIVGNHTLTYEELATVLTQIEACLNSRPLYPLTDNPEELQCITPGHFLIGDALLSPPQEDFSDTKCTRLQRWHLLQKLQQDFWRKWRSEYLHRLQQRPKWQRPSPNLEIGGLVLVKDERLPPLKWMMARILNTHPGTDGLVRVVELKTSSNIIRRPVHKLCPLPTHDTYWDMDPQTLHTDQHSDLDHSEK